MDGRNLIIYSKLSQMDQVSLLFDKKWETFEIFQEIISSFDVGSTFEVRGDHEEGFSSRNDSDGESLQIVDKLYNTQICF